MARSGFSDTNSFEFDGADFADETIIGVKDGVKRQLAEAGLDDEQAEYNAQFLASGLSTFAHRAGTSTEELYRALGLNIVRSEVKGEIKMYAQSVYHGGPVRGITEFSTDFIGTGEGAQSYGWGLYAGGVRDTGESYRKNIAVYPEIKKLPFNEDGTPNRAGQAAEYLFFGLDAVRFLKAIEPSWSEERIAETCQEGQKLLEEASKAGQLYRVDIPEDGALMDWDKPISEQPEKVKAIIESLITPEIAQYIGELKYLLKHLPGNNGDIPTTGEIFYNALSMVSGSEQAASLVLKEAGVPGHRYLDQLSRDKGEGTHNYVIYDGRNMKVRETYYQRGQDAEIRRVTLKRKLRTVKAGDIVDGRIVRPDVPNLGSIASTFFGEDYEALSGIREISLRDINGELFDPDFTVDKLDKRTRRLAEDISESGEIAPLIVAYGDEGLYVVEGGHRFDALTALGARSAPAVVVIENPGMAADPDTYYQRADLSERTMQAISSANTSLNQVPASFKSINWEPGTANADIGGGRYDAATEYLAGRGVTNLVFDPFNRDEKFNRHVFGELKKGTDTATVSNVLNVIAQPVIRQEVIRQAAKAIKPDGTAYFQIYEGSGNGAGQQTTKGWQNNAKTASYTEDVEKYFSGVTRKGNVITARGPMPGKSPALWMMDASGESFEYYQRGGRAPANPGPRGAIDFTDHNAVTITLTPRADATTTLHEMGHLFRWLMERQAALFPDNEQLQADWKAVRDFGGHEKFADVVIEYAMTGSAPSPALRRAFGMFKRCLTRFYEAIRGNTGVKLNDELKGVFNRILEGGAKNARKATAAISIDKRISPGDGLFFQDDTPHTNQAYKQTKTKEGGFMTVNLFDEDAIISEKVQKTERGRILSSPCGRDEKPRKLGVIFDQRREDVQILVRGSDADSFPAPRRGGLRGDALMEQADGPVGKTRLERDRPDRPDEPEKAAPQIRLRYFRHRSIP
jgi:hypothetical protein